MTENHCGGHRPLAKVTYLYPPDDEPAPTLQQRIDRRVDQALATARRVVPDRIVNWFG